MLNNSNLLTLECQKLIQRLDQLDFIDPFSQYYFNEIKAIESEILRLKTKSARKMITNKKLSVDISTSNAELGLIMEDIGFSCANNAQHADQMETKIFSNIHSYDFKPMNIKIKACIDFLDIYFQVEKSCTRHDIKKYLTEKTKIRHFIKESGSGYMIRLHDMHSINSINKRIGHLTTSD